MRVGPLVLFLVCLVFVIVLFFEGAVHTLDSQTCLMIIHVGLIVLKTAFNVLKL